MKIKILLLTLCSLLISSLGTSQTQNLLIDKKLFDKADMFLKRTLIKEKSPISFSSTKNIRDNNIRLMIEAKNSQVKSEIIGLGGSINTDLGNYFTIDIPKNRVLELLALEDITKVHQGGHFKKINEIAKQKIGADKVHQGLEGLNSAYTGKGVVVGIIDDGIDFTHPDFRDPIDTTKSRIAYLWNQTDASGINPEEYSYGSVWTAADIELELSGDEDNLIQGEFLDPYFGVGHGTHVIGTAAGNRGMAPEATIIGVTVDLADGAALIDALDFISQKAAEMGMPAVVNTSWGTQLQPGDGFDFVSFFYDQILDGNPQLGVCAAAGNPGPAGVFWGGNLEQDTVYNGKLAFESALADIYVANEHLDSLYLTIHVDSVAVDVNDPLGGYNYEKTVGSTTTIKFSDLLQLDFYTDTVFHSNGAIAGIINIFTWDISADAPGYPNSNFFVEIVDGVNWLNIQEESANMDFFRFEVSGNGFFYTMFDGFPVNLDNPSARGFSEEHFLPTRNLFNVGSPAIAFNVLSVGAYTNRAEIIDINGTPIPAFDEEGDLASFSAVGPSIDNRIKPEITAPGHMVLSSLSKDYLGNLGILDQIYGAAALGGDPNNPDLLFSGTSMASPMVTGTVALIWQANPDLSFSEIKEIIALSATKDNFTEAISPTPNPGWGHGKLNALAAVQEAERLLNTTSLVDFKENNIDIFPNPVSNQLNIDLSQSNTTVYSLFLTDLQGKTIGFEHFKNAPTQIQYSMGDLPVGAYFLSLTTDEGKISTKIIKQ